MTRTIAADLADRGVRVNAVSPGLVRTTATRPIWEADGGRGRGLRPSARPADRSRRRRRCGVLSAVRRRTTDHRDHAGRRRWESSREGLDADSLGACFHAYEGHMFLRGPTTWTQSPRSALAPASGDIPGSCTRRLSASAPTSAAARRVAPPFRPALGRDRLVVTERACCRRRNSRRRSAGPSTSPAGMRPSHTRRISTLAARPLATPRTLGSGGRASRGRHSFHEDAGSTPGGANGGGHRDGRAEDGHRSSTAREQRGITVEVPQFLRRGAARRSEVAPI